jgi:hypothetical protein
VRGQLESMDAQINLVKVFSVTKAKDRQAIGDHVTDWIAANPTVRVLRTVVALSSDSKFHCYSIVLFCAIEQ